MFLAKTLEISPEKIERLKLSSEVSSPINVKKSLKQLCDD